MPKPFDFTVGGPEYPFVRGLNTAQHQSTIAPNEAVTAYGVDVADTTLRGAFTDTVVTDTETVSAGYTAPAGVKFVWRDKAGGWYTSAYSDWACNNGALFTGPWGGSTYRRTYLTKKTSDTAAGNPEFRFNGAAYRLGMASQHAVTPTAVAGARALQRTYAFTHYSPSTGFESNPTTRTTAVLSGATISGIPLANATENGACYRRVYATKEGSPTGPLYYYATIENNTATSWTDTGGKTVSGLDPTPTHAAWDVVTTMDLDWGYGGEYTNDDMPFDHNPAPPLTCLAEEIMSIEGDDDSGVSFGAEKSIVRWTHQGMAWAWPEFFQHSLPDYVEALVYWQGQMFAMTSTGIWAFSGGADYAIAPVKTGSVTGVREGFGKTARATPYGIIFLAREGIALFDGVSTHILTAGILNPSDFAPAATYGNAAYFDGFYLLNLWGQAKVISLDLRRGLAGVIVTEQAMTPAAFYVGSYTSVSDGTFYDARLYIAPYAGGTPRHWRPSAQATPRYSTWKWRTGALTMGAPGLTKRFNRLRVTHRIASGSITLKVTAGDDLNLGKTSYYPALHTITLTPASGCLFWLPPAMQGRALVLEATANDAEAEIYDLSVEGEVFNAA